MLMVSHGYLYDIVTVDACMVGWVGYDQLCHSYFFSSIYGHRLLFNSREEAIEYIQLHVSEF